MKYLMTFSVKDPSEKNLKKAMEIQSKRIEKGEAFGDDMIFPIHQYMTKSKSFMVIETDDPLKLSKWVADYISVFDYEIIPIIQWNKIQKYYT
jgi:hypothetical protein